MSDTKSAKVRRFLEWVAPREGLESLAGEPRLLEGSEPSSACGSTSESSLRAMIARKPRQERAVQEGTRIHQFLVPILPGNLVRHGRAHTNNG